jgi:hypothetical protein
MGKCAVIYLGHLNPLTRAHESILTYLQKYYKVYVFPVRFLKGCQELNTKSFPFPYEIRKAMIESLFNNNGNAVRVLSDYTFFSPFIKYFPPLVSPYSWRLRNHILRNIEEETFVSYTGDRLERIALMVYGLHPVRAKRLGTSSTAIKEMLYRQAAMENIKEIKNLESSVWHDMVPEKVVDLINNHWGIIQKFANSPDSTVRIMGVKFPKDGLF